MGTDSRQAGQRDDPVLTLARVDVDLNPSATRASVVSIPRDAWVDIPDRGPGKISSAYGLGGPTLLVQTVEQLTHNRIDHFAIIDYAGFQHMVDAVGGIDVQGGHLDGPAALSYVSQGTATRPSTATGSAGSRPPSGHWSTRRRRTACSATRSSSSACSTP